MAHPSDDADNDSDYENSLITQFETTLTIHPSSNEALEQEDISIDHTTINYGADMPQVSNHTFLSIKEEEEDEVEESPQGPHDPSKKERLRSRRSRERESLREMQRHGVDLLERLGDDRKLFENLLVPSSLIDESMLKFKKVFADFLSSNPQIQSQSPRFPSKNLKTLIVLSPLSVEHAFGRAWVSKSYLATIFERPQRLLAACIGIAAAITMYPFFYSLKNSVKRSSIFSRHVLKVHGKKWPTDLIELCIKSHKKLLNNELEVPEDWNVGDIYLTPKSLIAMEGSIGAIETSIDSMFGRENQKLVFCLLRPPGHHCHAALPSGFCLLNNVQIGIEYAFERYGVSHCAILDIDLHHGDGSQDICWERAGFEGDYGILSGDELDNESDPRDEFGKKFASYPKVGYFSLHDIKSYPTELGYATRDKIKNASTCIMDHDLNIWNVHLQTWANEEEFYKNYRTKYVNILNRANQFLNNAKKSHEEDMEIYVDELAKYNKYISKFPNNHSIKKPKPPIPFKPLIIMSSGFDASEYENSQMQRHNINVPTSFYATFTNDVVKLANIHTGGKILSFLEGGYSDGALTTGVFSHLIGLVNLNIEPQDSSLWNSTWGNEQVMKELVKGCKKSWQPYKKPQIDVTIWANEVIKLGRSIMPNSIISSSHIYNATHDQSKDTVRPGKNNEMIKLNRMVRELMDVSALEIPSSPIKPDPEDSRKVLRHTRAYYKRLIDSKSGTNNPEEISKDCKKNIKE